MQGLAFCDRDIERPFSNQEAMDKLDAFLAARKRGDDESALRIAQEFPLAPSLAQSMKRLYGAQAVRESGWDLSQAEKAFGRDWLDR